ncbi:MAG: WD40 repeat domain-containing protein, partial [Candidatus Babeliales bacterium]
MTRILIGLYTVLISASIGAAQVTPEPVKPAQRAIAWDGPQIETKAKKEQEEKKKKAAVATTALIKKDNLIRGLEVIYGCEFNEKEQKFEQQIREEDRFDANTKEMVKHRYIPQGLPKTLIRIIVEYASHFGRSRIFTIPDLGPKKIDYREDLESGMCASFVNSDNMRIYIVECKKPGHFKLYDEQGRECAYCTAHKAPLTRIFVVPELAGKKYAFVTGSRDGTVRFWNEKGEELGHVAFEKSRVCDFDIATDVAVQDKKLDFLVIALGLGTNIIVCDISAVDHIVTYNQAGWGNVGATRVKLLVFNNRLIAVTCEEAMSGDPVFGEKEQAVCFYDVI